jgi:hypothetical protein
MMMTSKEWMLRVDNWGHEPTMRIDLHSDGEIRVARGRKTKSGRWQPAGPEWRGGFLGRVSQNTAIKAYQAAAALPRRVNLTDFSLGCDVDSGYEVTLVTARGSFQVRIFVSELYKDKALRESLSRLVEVLDGSLPSPRIGRVEGVRNE